LLLVRAVGVHRVQLPACRAAVGDEGNPAIHTREGGPGGTATNSKTRATNRMVEVNELRATPAIRSI
jgi:hypothetical protein